MNLKATLGACGVLVLLSGCATMDLSNIVDTSAGFEDEDFPVGEGIQDGFHAGAQSHITFGTNEPALAFYHRAITSAIAVAAKLCLKFIAFPPWLTGVSSVTG